MYHLEEIYYDYILIVQLFLFFVLDKLSTGRDERKKICLDNLKMVTVSFS